MGSETPQPAEPGPAAGGQEPPKRRKPRWRRILKWALISLTTLIVLVVALVWLVLANVNHPFVKSRVVSIVKSSTGLDIDYEDLDISLWSGVKADSFSIAAPEKFSAHGEEFVRVDGLDVSASLWSLAFGDLDIESVSIDSIAVNVAADETGATTLTELFPPKEKKKEDKKDKKPTPLSETLAALPELRVGSIELGELRAQAVQIRGGSVETLATVAGLSLSGSVRSSEGLDGSTIRIFASDKLEIEVAREAEARTAELAVDLKIAATQSDVTINGSIDVVSQELIDLAQPIRSVLAIEAKATFDRQGKRTSIELESLRLLDGRARAVVSAEIPDGETLTATATGQVNLDIDEMPIAAWGVAVRDLGLEIKSNQFGWDGRKLSGAATFSGGVKQAGYKESQASEVQLSGEGNFDGGAGAFDLSATVAMARAKTESLSAEANAIEVAVDGTAKADGEHQLVTAKVNAKMQGASYAAPGTKAKVTKLVADATTSGRLGDLIAGIIGKAEATVRFENADATQRRDRFAAKNAVAKVVATGLAPDKAAVYGFRGDAVVSADIAAANARTGGTPLTASTIAARFEVPLTLATASGTISLAALKRDKATVRGAEFSVAATAPLALAPGEPGGATATIKGAVSGARFAENRGSISVIDIRAVKTAGDKYNIELDTVASSLFVAGQRLSGRLVADIKADADLGSAPSLVADATIRGPDGSKLVADADVKVARRTGQLDYKAKARAERLESVLASAAALSPSVSKVDVEGATFNLSASGKLRGLVRAPGRELPSPTPNPLETLRGKQSVDVEIANIAYREPGRKIRVPGLKASFASEHGAKGAGRADLSITSERVRMESGADAYDVRGISETLTATFDRAPSRGTVKIDSKLTIKSATQTVFPEYKVANLSLDSEAELDRLKSLFLRELVFVNPAAGTRLTASGALEKTGLVLDAEETIPGREALTLEGQLTQKLEHMGAWGMATEASGSMVVPFRVESGDLLSYRLVAKLIATDINYRSASGKLAIEKLNGVIPMASELAILPTGVILVPGPRTSPLSRTRFFDVHPFLDSDDYITARSIEFAGEKIGPLAGNVRLARSVFSIDQLQVGYRRGQVSGQVRADYREGDPIVRARLNFTGIRPQKGGDVLDANAAVTFVPRTLTVDGKVQIVRLSREHLRDLLDIIDPFHETVNVNKVRLGLKVGFPKFVRLRMRDGAMDAKVELGGVAKVVRIDEIKAVPMGPIMQKYVAPALSGLLPKLVPQESR